MQSRVKLLGVEGNLTSATNVSAAKLVRVHNVDAGSLLLTQKNAEAATIASATLTSGEVVYVEKSSTDTLEGGANLLAVAVAFR